MSSQIRGRSVWVPPVENNADIPHKKYSFDCLNLEPIKYVHNT